MSNTVLPLALVGSMCSSVAAVAYGIQTGAIPTGKSEPEPAYVAPVPSAPLDMMDSGSMMVDDFVIQGDADEADVTAILEEEALTPYTSDHSLDSDDDQISGLAGMPINCGPDDDENQTALQSFGLTSDNKYGYKCSSLENPGELKFGTAGKYVSSRGEIENLHQAQALCASNQALVGFVLDQNKSKTKLGYRYDCINLKGPAKIRTALTSYKPYKSGDDGETELTGAPRQTAQLAVLQPTSGIGDISCNEGELLQGFAVEKSGNNMRYIYRCVTPAYEAD
ncbi:hypothetical protein MPVG_00038 [Micromonas pusilla virus 12T]|uniref:hypothetical protein n=1 Tax=Micromonas pusilla virus 12T TaxID=755272 RepID=UPI0002C1347D|nr:hypothetical protein MPVG_00038 [Micromonas pusilla virus 12T]AGH30861.1 hypothetical protein MPVG_00038 [Micromonas pusilla virus 12T]